MRLLIMQNTIISKGAFLLTMNFFVICSDNSSWIFILIGAKLPRIIVFFCFCFVCLQLPIKAKNTAHRKGIGVVWNLSVKATIVKWIVAVALSIAKICCPYGFWPTITRISCWGWACTVIRPYAASHRASLGTKCNLCISILLKTACGRSFSVVIRCINHAAPATQRTE